MLIGSEQSQLRDVVIIGAGPAGSGLATALSRLGWNVLLIERGSFPRHKVCGEFLSPESQASLHALGLYATVADLDPRRMEAALLVSRRGRRLRIDLPGAAWGISRFALDQALAEAARAAGTDVRTGTTVTGVASTEQGYAVTMRADHADTTVPTRAIVMACGRHPLRALRATDPTAQSRPSFVGVKCHYRDLVMPPEVELFWFDGGYAGLTPIEGGITNVCLLVTREAFQRTGGNVLSMIAAAARLNPAFGRRLMGAEPLPTTAVAVAPVDPGVAACPWDGSPRVGDAAVMVPPLCGDGQAMALRSAELCAPLTHDFLRGRLTRAAWATAYQTAWQREFDRTVCVSRLLQTLLSMPIVDDALLGIGNLFPWLAARLFNATRSRYPHAAITASAAVSRADAPPSRESRA